MKQKYSLDIGKFVCALFVLFVHANPFGSYTKVLMFGFRNVVGASLLPFFFATSGYLLAKKLGSAQNSAEQNGYMRKYLKRLIQIYLIWSVVYFPFVVVTWMREGFSIMLVLEYLRDFFFEGSYSTIWFLPALISGTTIYWLLLKKFSHKQVFFISCGVYVITLLLSSYYGISMKIPVLSKLAESYYVLFDSVKNGLLCGLIFLSVGGMVANESCFLNFSRGKALLGVIISLALQCFEVLGYMLVGNVKGVDTTASLVLWGMFTLLFALSFDLKPSNAWTMLRKLSMLLFLTQRIPISVIDLFMEESVIATNSLANFVAVTLSTFAISFLILQLSKKLKWLNKIY